MRGVGRYEGDKAKIIHPDYFCYKKCQQNGNLNTKKWKIKKKNLLMKNYCSTHPNVFTTKNHPCHNIIVPCVLATVFVSAENINSDSVLDYKRMYFEHPMKLPHPTRVITIGQNLEPFILGIKGNSAKLRCGGRQLVNHADANDNFRVYGIVDCKKQFNGYTESKMVRSIKKWLN